MDYKCKISVYSEKEEKDQTIREIIRTETILINNCKDEAELEERVKKHYDIFLNSGENYKIEKKEIIPKS